MSRPRPRVLSVIAAVVGCALALAACGKGGGDNAGHGGGPAIGQKGGQSSAAQSLGFPDFATKNTTRVGGADPIADAAGVAQAVFASPTPAGRPAAVTLVDARAWQAGIAAAALTSKPIGAPVLLTNGHDLPAASKSALAALEPVGSKAASGAQIIRVGDVAAPGGYKTTSVSATDAYGLAAAVDRLHAAAAGGSSDSVVIASGDQPAYAMPAAGWAAKSGDAVLFVRPRSVPAATMKALKRHQQPRIYVLGPPSVVSNQVLKRLRSLGTVRRIAGPDAATTAIAFARFVDGSFGWGVTDPGHGLVFANPTRPSDAVAAAPLSSSGTYGPLLLTQRDGQLSPQLVQYLLDIQPGYDKDPVRGVYNHGWLMGDASAVPVAVQARIDTLLEIVPVAAGSPPAGSSP